MPQPTRLDYCQYLLSSPINYTLTHLADHSQQFSHDMINRYLAGERIRPTLGMGKCPTAPGANRTRICHL